MQMLHLIVAPAVTIFFLSRDCSSLESNSLKSLISRDAVMPGGRHLASTSGIDGIVRAKSMKSRLEKKHQPSKSKEMSLKKSIKNSKTEYGCEGGKGRCNTVGLPTPTITEDVPPAPAQKMTEDLIPTPVPTCLECDDIEAYQSMSSSFSLNHETLSESTSTSYKTLVVIGVFLGLVCAAVLPRIFRAFGYRKTPSSSLFTTKSQSV